MNKKIKTVKTETKATKTSWQKRKCWQQTKCEYSAAREHGFHANL